MTPGNRCPVPQPRCPPRGELMPSQPLPPIHRASFTCCTGTDGPAGAPTRNGTVLKGTGAGSGFPGFEPWLGTFWLCDL